jgi:hypothetical protein
MRRGRGSRWRRRRKRKRKKKAENPVFQVRPQIHK